MVKIVKLSPHHSDFLLEYFYFRQSFGTKRFSIFYAGVFKISSFDDESGNQTGGSMEDKSKCKIRRSW